MTNPKIQQKSECVHNSRKGLTTLIRLEGSINKYFCSVCDVVFYRPKSYGNFPAKFKSYTCNVRKCSSGGVIKRKKINGEIPVWWCKEHMPEVYVEEFINERITK